MSQHARSPEHSESEAEGGPQGGVWGGRSKRISSSSIRISSSRMSRPGGDGNLSPLMNEMVQLLNLLKRVH